MLLSRVQNDIVSKIVDYICQANLPAGSRLTETQLAEEFSVSRSPVRAALKVLEKKQVVAATANKGFHLVRDASMLRKDELKLAPPLDGSLYDRIALDRMRNRLPEQITEAEFLRRYKVTRTDLLRILTRMSNDGLIRRSAGHGWIFLPSLSTPETYAASYSFRSIIEPAGLLEKTFSLDAHALNRARAGHQKMLDQVGHGKLNGREVFDINANFHEMLARMSGNRFILQAVEQQNRLRQLSEYYVYEDESRIESSFREHCEIMDVLLNGDQEWAATLLRRHLDVASRMMPPFQKS